MQILSINIIPNKVSYQLLTSFSAIKYGNILSTENKINVNNGEHELSIIYNDLIFKKLNVVKFAASLVNILNHNLPNEVFQLVIKYHYSTSEYDYFDTDTFDAIKHVYEFFTNLIASNQLNIFKSVECVQISKKENNDESVFDLFDSYENDDEDNDKPSYDTSHIWMNSKNIQRSIKRHGVVVAYSKKDYKKDRDLVKKFIKEFLPGKTKWKRKFREQLLDRWMYYYAITKNDLEKKEKKYRKRIKKKTDKIKTRSWNNSTNMDMTIMNRWNDISK